MDKSTNLCNGTHLVVDYLDDRIIQATILSGSIIGDKVLISKITRTPSDTSKILLIKSQGQSPSHVGFFLPKPFLVMDKFMSLCLE